MEQPPSSYEHQEEELLVALASGKQEALIPLYHRYAPLVFGIAARALGRDGAEDIVQEVFAVVWRNSSQFDPVRGNVRTWILQIARSRTLNELRRRRRSPEREEELDLEQLTEPDGALSAEDALWEEYRRTALRRALDGLPLPQRDALRLAFLEQLTHEDVAAALQIPLGTTKTRIRTGVRRLRTALAAIAAAILVAVGSPLFVRYRSEQALQQRTDRALRLAVASDLQVLRLTATSRAAPEAHGTYRWRPGSSMAILTLSNVPAVPSGKAYQGWALEKGNWVSLGVGRPDDSGRALIIGEAPALAADPQGIQVTPEPRSGSQTPTGPPVIAWSPH